MLLMSSRRGRFAVTRKVLFLVATTANYVCKCCHVNCLLFLRVAFCFWSHLVVRLYGLIAAIYEAAIHGVRVSLRLNQGHYLLADLGVVYEAVQVFQETGL